MSRTITASRVIRLVVLAFAGLAMFLTYTYASGAHAAPVVVTHNAAPNTCQEDEACWDCTSMGNHVCGPHDKVMHDELEIVVGSLQDDLRRHEEWLRELTAEHERAVRTITRQARLLRSLVHACRPVNTGGGVTQCTQPSMPDQALTQRVRDTWRTARAVEECMYANVYSRALLGQCLDDYRDARGWR